MLHGDYTQGYITWHEVGNSEALKNQIWYLNKEKLVAGCKMSIVKICKDIFEPRLNF